MRVHRQKEPDETRRRHARRPDRARPGRAGRAGELPDSDTDQDADQDADCNRNRNLDGHVDDHADTNQHTHGHGNTHAHPDCHPARWDRRVLLRRRGDAAITTNADASTSNHRDPDAEPEPNIEPDAKSDGDAVRADAPAERGELTAAVTVKHRHAHAIGLWLRSIRKESRRPLSQVGPQLGVSKQSLSEYERGTVSPDIETMLRAAEYFEYDPFSVLSEFELLPESTVRYLKRAALRIARGEI